VCCNQFTCMLNISVWICPYVSVRVCMCGCLCQCVCMCVSVCVCFSDEHSSVESQEHAGKRKSSTAVGRKQTKKRKLDTAPNPLDATWIHPESYELTDK